MVIPFPHSQPDEAEKQLVEARDALTEQLAMVNTLIRNLRIVRESRTSMDPHNIGVNQDVDFNWTEAIPGSLLK